MWLRLEAYTVLNTCCLPSLQRANTAGGASALSPAELANAQSDSDAEPDHRIIHQSIRSGGRGPPTLELADSSEDEMLQMHTDHFGSRREDEIGGALCIYLI